MNESYKKFDFLLKIVYDSCMKNSKGVLRMAFSEKLFDENFTFSFKTMVASNINIATKAFDLFWEKNAIFLRKFLTNVL